MTSTEQVELFRFDDTFARGVPELSVAWSGAPVPEPRLLVLNEPLAAELGVNAADLRSPAGVALLAAQAPTGVPTVAQVYAGHQFGSYVPRLGDGRALLLGEVVDTAGRRRDLHLKGSGRTPFARGGDGKAVIGPMLREYLVGEAMHALGIPTTRGLSVVATGERVLRERPLPGAILCRVAASHLRVGTFQYAAATGEPGLLRSLADYAIARHHPGVAAEKHRYLAFFEEVVAAQADLVARWMLVGFIHGVMNTDNMTISGETIDYGPCAFLDAYDPATVFSSIDYAGRYAYGNQPAAAQWNLARLAETLLPLLAEPAEAAVEAATAVLHGFANRYQRAFEAGMADKLGLPASADQTPGLAAELLTLLAEHRVDFTGFFRALAAGTAGALFTGGQAGARAAYEAWAARRDALLPTDPAERGELAAGMNRVNPVYIPRNHRVEEALSEAAGGDLAGFHRLLDAVTAPYDERPGLEDLTGPGPTQGPRYVTYCGT